VNYFGYLHRKVQRFPIDVTDDDSYLSAYELQGML